MRQFVASTILQGVLALNHVTWRAAIHLASRAGAILYGCPMEVVPRCKASPAMRDLEHAARKAEAMQHSPN